MSLIRSACALVASVALVFALCGCAGRGYLSDAVDDEGTYTVTADDAAKGAAVAALGGGVTIEDGEALDIRPDLERGSLQVRLIDEAGTVVLDVTASGTASSVHALGPGEYSMSVACNEDGTTGTLVIAARP